MSVPVPIAELATYVMCSGTGLAITTLSVGVLPTLVAVIVQTIWSPGTALAAGTRRLTFWPFSTTSLSVSPVVLSSTQALSAPCAAALSSVIHKAAHKVVIVVFPFIVPSPDWSLSIDGHGELNRLRPGSAAQIPRGAPHCGGGGRERGRGGPAG